jgi:Immunity protein 74
MRLRRSRDPRPTRTYPDLKTDLTRSYLRLEVEGRWAIVRGEAFLPGYGSPDFEVLRKEVEWVDGEPVGDDERDRILETLLASADERGLRVEIV